MFGGSAPSGGFSFGANNNNNNQQQQQQPAGGGLFGQPQQQQNSTFGGGGNTGFGGATGGGIFGGAGQQQQQQSGGLFGGAQQNAQQPAASGFAFGQTPQQQQPAAGPFGAKPAGTFGATGGFGNTANTGTSSGFTFGQNNNQQPQSTGFGQPAGSNVFGAKPAGSGLFGQQSQPAGGIFGQAQQQQQQPASTNVFGGAAATPAQVTTGSLNPPYQPTTVAEKDNQNNTVNMAYQSIVAMNQYKSMSADELRFQDYEQGRKSGNGGASASTGSGFGFGQQPGQTNTGGGIFGSGNQTNPTPAFGQPQQQPQQGGGLFGQQNQNTSSGFFGQQQQQPQQSGGLFGQQQQQPQQQQSGGLFGNQQNTQQPAASPFSFGANNNNTNNQQQQPASTGFSFGAANNNAPKPGGLFGNNTGGFGSTQPQQPASNTGGAFSFGQQNNQQQQQPGQTSGAFGSSSGFSFGAANPQKPATGGLFGSSQPSTTPAQPAFGGFGTGASGAGAAASKPAFSFGSQAPATSGGAFGSAPAPSGGLFGAGSSQPTTTSQPTAGGGLFAGFGQQSNQQQQQQPQQSGFGFGAANNNNTNNNAAGGGLFGGGAAKPGGLFGNTTSQPQGTSGFGTGGSAGGFSFGGANNQNQQNQQQKPGGLFGSGTTGTGATGGLFGGGNTGGGGLFGQSNTGGGAAGGQSGGLFGNTNNNNQGAAGSSLFGQSSLGGGAGQGSNFGASSGGLFGSTNNQQQQSSGLPPQGVGLTSDPYGTDALFRSMTGGGAANQPSLPFNVSASSSAHQNPTLSASLKSKPLPAPMMSPFRPNPKNASRIVRLRGGTPARDSSPSASGAFGRSASPALNGANGLFKGMSDEIGSPGGDGGLPSQAFVPRQSVKRLVLTDAGGNSSFGRSARGGTEEPNAGSTSFKDSVFGNQRSSTIQSRSAASAAGRGVTFSPALEAGLGSNKRGATAGPTGDESFGDSFNRSRSNLFNETPSKANNVLQAGGRDLFGRGKSQAGPVAPAEPELSLEELPTGSYHLSPSLGSLRRMGHAQLSHVENFTVSRKGFGSVRYLVPVDLTSIDDLGVIAGGIVQLREKEVWVYPSRDDLEPGLDGMKAGYERNPVPEAKRGEALNQPAEVTLERCWPLDKATRQPLKDASHPRVKQHIAKLQKKGDTRFIFFEPEGGVWTFEVDHFSRYGLDDETEEEASADKKPQRSGAKQSRAADDDDDDAPPPRRQLRGSSRKAEGPPSLTSASSDEEDSDEDVELISQTSTDLMRESELEDEDAFVRGGKGSQDWMPTESTPRAARFRTPRQGSARPRDTPDVADSQVAAAERPWAAQLGVEARRVQVMQASFFGDRAPGESEDKKARTPWEENDAKRKFGERGHEVKGAVAVEKQGRSNFGRSTIAETPARPELSDVAPIANKVTKIDLQDSVAQGFEGVPSDLGLALGRSFRVGWGPGGLLVHGGRVQGVLTADKVSKSAKETDEAQPPSVLRIEESRVFKNNEEEEKTRALRLLETQLANTEIQGPEEAEFESDSECPVAFPDSSLRFSHFASLFENVDKSHEALVFRLGVALFDEIDLKLPPYATSDAVQAVSSIRRKAALSDWLRNAVSGVVESEARGHVAASRAAALTFTHLTAYQVEKACSSALDAGDFRLATLLAQIDGGDDDTRAEIAEQLAIWRSGGVDAHISKEHRRIYEVLSGNVTISPGSVSRSVHDPTDRVEDLHIAQGLDWKRAFGLHLWYGASHSSSLTSAFERYEAAVGGPGETAPPLPPYREKASMGSIRLKELLKTGSYDRDALFQLIKLYSSSTFDLESALCPFGFGPVTADYRMPWHLYMLLSRAMRRRDFNDRAGLDADMAEQGEAMDALVEGNSARADVLTSDYAHQLELQGQWTWAAFVLLHLELEDSRIAAIKALLARNVRHFDDASTAFLTARLKVPRTWIYEAEAIAARSRDDRFAEFELLIKARMFGAAHRVVVRRLAPEAIIRGDSEMILSLFSPFEQAFPDGLHQLPGWANGGQIYTDYVACIQQLPGLIIASETGKIDATGRARLERLAPRVHELIQALPSLFDDCGDDLDGPENLSHTVVLSDMMTALHNLARTLSVHNFAPKVTDAWTSSTIPPEIEQVQNSANDYLDLLLGVA